MPIGTRDILLVVRAKDQASRVIRDVGRSFDSLSGAAEQSALRMLSTGSALVGIGVATAAVGAAGLSAAKDWTDAAVEYNKAAAVTLTQVDELGVSLETIKNIGRDVASTVPAIFDQMQPALYDIFSSMDITAAESQRVLEEFARASVAGNVDVQTAGRSSIAIMNAWGLGVDDLSRVMDVQFQLVRKGVGTYEEFASNLGKAIPSARKAGQEVETLSGMMAFLTRNGLSASMSSTAAARAMDNLTNPRVIDRMAKIGVQVLDGSGNFRQMNEIVNDLGKSMAGLTDAQRAKALQEIFQGSGNNIQARRFWDLAIKNFDQLDERTKEMIGSKGALQDAYDIMFNQPANQAQLLSNNLEILKTELGDALLPVFNKVVSTAAKMVQWVRNLNPETKKMIAFFVATASAAFVLIGALTAGAGSIIMIAGAIKLMGGLGAVFSIFMKLNFWILLIAAAAYIIYRNWDSIRAWWDHMWPGFKKTALDVWSWLKKTWEELWPHIKAVADVVWQWMQKTWDVLWPAIKATVKAVFDWLVTNWPKIVEGFKTGWEIVKQAWDTVVSAVQTVWSWLKSFGEWFWNIFGPGLTKVWQAIKENAGPIVRDLIDIFQGIWTVVSSVVTEVAHIVDTVWSKIWPPMHWALEKLWALWKFVWNHMQPILRAFFTYVGRTIAGIIRIFRGILDFIVGIFSGNWGKAWDGIKAVFGAVWDGIKALLELGWEAIKALFSAMWDAFKNLAGIVADAFGAVWDFIKSIPGRIWDLVKSAGTWLLNTGTEMMLGMLNGIVNTAENVWTWFKELPGNIWDWVKEAVTWLVTTGASIVQGLLDGLYKGIVAVAIWFLSLPLKIWEWVKNAARWLIDTGEKIMEGLWEGLKKVWNKIKDWFLGIVEDVKGFFRDIFNSIPGLGGIDLGGLNIEAAAKALGAPVGTGAGIGSIGASMPASNGTSSDGGQKFAGPSTTIESGAVQIHVGSATPETVPLIERAVNKAMSDLLVAYNIASRGAIQS